MVEGYIRGPTGFSLHRRCGGLVVCHQSVAQCDQCPPLHFTPFFTAWEDTFTMKLLFTLLVVSALTLKVEGAAKAYDAACTEGTDTCSTTNTDCKDDGTGTDKCLCSVNYVYDGTSACKKVGGQPCTEATKADCASGTCTAMKCDGKEANGAACTINADCMSFNCQWKDGTQKCAEAASATVVASLTLMLVTLVTTRFL